MVAVYKGMKLDVVRASVTKFYDLTFVTNQFDGWYTGLIHGAMGI